MKTWLALASSLLVGAMSLLGGVVTFQGDVAFAQGVPAVPYQVIVNAQNPTTKVSREFLANAFLKKTTRWENDDVILPVDLDGDSSVRRRFTEEVLRRSVAAVRSYWQQIIFSGRGVPPPEMDSDDEVVKYVSKHRGAVGYVSGAANLDGTRLLKVQ